MNIAIVFPGQGSQSVGMLAAYTEEWTQVKDTFKEASDVLGYDLWDVVANGPEEKLNQTEITQPAVLAADVSVMRILKQQCMLRPFVLAGHSLGEYAALVAADSIEFTDAIKLVAERGRLMQSAVPEGKGAMAAILNLSDDQIITICENISNESDEVVEAVNFNSPGQVVIAGNTAAVDKAIEACKEEGAKRALKLPVSVPSHSSLMKPAAEKLAETLKSVDIKTPQIQVIHNVNAKSHDDPDDIRDALTRQLYNPVRWVQTAKIIGSAANDAIIECGPGKVLSGLSRRITKDVPTFALDTPTSMQKFLDTMDANN